MAEQPSRVENGVLDGNGNVRKSRQTRETSKTVKSQTKKSSDNGTKVSRTASEDSLLAAENFIRDIDTSITSVPSKRIKVRSCHVNPGSVISTGSLRATSNLEITSAGQSRLVAFDQTGQVDLDAVEKWVSTPQVDIDFNKMELDTGVSVSKCVIENDSVKTKMQKADLAVEEINTIIGTLPQIVTDGHLNQPEINEVQTTSCPENYSVSHSPSVSSTSNENTRQIPECIPTPSFPRPMQSIRLPPVNTDSVSREDIFHRKITDMSVLHMPHYLPKLDTSDRNSVTKIQKSTEPAVQADHLDNLQKSTEPTIQADHSGNLQKSGSAGRPTIAISQYLLPGQVPDRSFNPERNGGVEIRNIVLDYSASENEHKKKRCRLFKLCTRFSCCRAQTYEIEEIRQENVENHMGTDNETEEEAFLEEFGEGSRNVLGFEKYHFKVHVHVFCQYPVDFFLFWVECNVLFILRFLNL